jgi:ribosomal protein S14
MTAYLPVVLGQDALQWLQHLPRNCIDDWSDFSRCFIANFQSLSDKPWDLKSIRCRGDETPRSYLKRFQTMRNCIPEVAEAVVIEDFYRGSNDSAFVRAILQKAPTTSEQLFREADLYITADECAQNLIGGMKPTPSAPRCDANQQTDKR